jgi:hypothetical protein
VGVLYSFHFHVHCSHVKLPVDRPDLLHDQRIEDGNVEFLRAWNVQASSNESVLLVYLFRSNWPSACVLLDFAL